MLGRGRSKEGVTTKVDIKSIFKRATELIILFIVSGFIYCCIEMLYRGRTHISMFFVAGLCGLVMNSWNNIFTFEMDFLLQVMLSAIVCTAVELCSGLLINANHLIWDYSSLPLNYKGQVCLYFSLVWVAISAFAIPILDWVEWKVFGYQPTPYYRIGSFRFSFNGS